MQSVKLSSSDGTVEVAKDARTPRCVGPSLTCMQVILDGATIKTMVKSWSLKGLLTQWGQGKAKLDRVLDTNSGQIKTCLQVIIVIILTRPRSALMLQRTIMTMMTMFRLATDRVKAWSLAAVATLGKQSFKYEFYGDPPHL